MAELIDIRRVVIGPENMVAHVRLAEDAPLMTSEDLEGTSRVYRLLPHIVDHVCLGDAGDTFRDAMGNTELAHLLEHVTVELLAQTDLAGDMPAGRTWVDEVDDRTYQIELACPDDVLTAAALSCGVWLLDWAYRDGGEPEPDIDAIVNGLVQLVKKVKGMGEDMVVDYGLEPEESDEWDEEGDAYDEPADDEEVEPETLDYEDEEPADDAPMDETAEFESIEDVAEDEPAAEDLTNAFEPTEPVEDDRPLWTEAPDLNAPATRGRRAVVSEAEVDQIMATLEFPVLPQDEPNEGKDE